jgi:hypothetical protein
MSGRDSPPPEKFILLAGPARISRAGLPLERPTYERFRAGDPAAFEAIIRAHAPLVRAIVGRLWRSVFRPTELLITRWTAEEVRGAERLRAIETHQVRIPRPEHGVPRDPGRYAFRSPKIPVPERVPEFEGISNAGGGYPGDVEYAHRAAGRSNKRPCEVIVAVEGNVKMAAVCAAIHTCQRHGA